MNISVIFEERSTTILGLFLLTQWLSINLNMLYTKLKVDVQNKPKTFCVFYAFVVQYHV